MMMAAVAHRRRGVFSLKASALARAEVCITLNEELKPRKYKPGLSRRRHSWNGSPY